MTTAGQQISIDTFDSLDPATGQVVGTFPITSEAEVRAAVERARTAAAWWRDLGFDGRKRRLLAWKSVMARRADELVALIRQENGKTVGDAVIELALVLDHLSWAARNAERVLGLRKVRSTLLLADQAAVLEYPPAGVVGVIGPWNYPLHTPMGSVGYALAAGNAVVYKPSEFTPAVARWAVDTFAEVVGEHPVLQLVTGFGDTGAALCRSGVDVLAFTGSAATGRKVMAACAQTLTKVVMECGGDDAMIVADDADLDAAADAAVWGACSNAGQTCAGVERVYVVDSVYDAFVAKAVERAQRLRAGSDETADVGPITMPAQIDVIRRQLDDALKRGATALVGGPESIKPPYVEPIVLVDVPDDSTLMRDETFGPILPISRVRDVEDAIARTNDSAYGLGAAVFSKRRGMQIARQLDVGMVSVNSVLTYAGMPALPFGGRGESGYGRIHGEDGLREFALPRAITRSRLRLPLPLTFWSFSRAPWLLPTVRKVVGAIHRR